MKVSLDWLKDYLALSQSPKEIADALTALGLEASFENKGKSFSGVVLGKVLKCEPHENADNLSLCIVDTGDNENYNIVCGAPNVKSGIYVPVAKVGASLKNGEFKIKEAKLRGVISSGMICSGMELNINDDHEGIMILETKEKLGTPIEDIINFNEDVVFELDLTPNRGDCLSHLGVARELGIVSGEMVHRKPLRFFKESGSSASEIKIHIDASDACPRYAVRIIKDVKVGPSPKWLIDRLKSIGLSSINNIVDAANYVLMDSGHPMHTFDLSQIFGNEINVRYAKKGETFTTLDAEKRKLSDFHLLICDGEKPIALARIMGGLNTQITERTTSLLIESAYFNPTIIRKGAKSLDLSTEASRRFERDTDIEGVIPAVDQLAQLILEVAGGIVSKDVLDEYPDKKKENKILFSVGKCQDLLGIKLSDKKVQKIFSSLNIKHTNKNGSIQCIIPTFRNDLDREVDLCEEIARVIGYDNIPVATQFSASYTSFVEDQYELDSLLRSQLCANGFHEHYSNSLQHQNYTRHFSVGEAVQLKNPLSQDMEFVRNSILPGLLMAASYNEKRQEKGFKLFEIGAVHNQSTKSATGSKEKFHLGLLWYGDVTPHWREYEERDVFRSKGEVAHILQSIGIKNISFKLSNVNGLKSSMKIYSNKTLIGNLGIPEPEVLKAYDFNLSPTICDLSIHIMRDIWQNKKMVYKSPVLFPSITRDIALQVSCDISAADLIDSIWKQGGSTLSHVLLFDVYQSEDVGASKKSLAFSLKFQSKTSTLTDSEVDQDMGKILKSIKKIHGAIQR